MTEPSQRERPRDQKGEEIEPPTIIDISERAQIRKERYAAVIFVLLIAGLSYLIYVNLH